MLRNLTWTLIGSLMMAGCGTAPEYDVVIRGGMIYDGSGSPPFRGDVAIAGDSVAAVGEVGTVATRLSIDASGLAVSPGFINMLSWATVSLLHDGRSMSDILQGVTLEIFGEGTSMGPLNEEMKKRMIEGQGDIRFDVAWTTLDEYLRHLETRGVSPNVASFVGATTIRVNVLGYEDRAPTSAELEEMKAIVRTAMEEGALGVGSSLIYAPAFYAGTNELAALAEEAGRLQGRYISHIRSEGNRLLDAVDEFLEIARRGRLPAEIYHLKVAGQSNWHKVNDLIQKLEEARREGLPISANMYTYTAGATGLDAAMPPWVQEGGLQEWIRRLKDPSVRKRVLQEMRTPSDEWENLYLAAGSPEKVLLVSFRNETLKPLTGMSLAEVARQRGVTPEEAAIDLVIEDESRVGTVYFLMSEENVRRKLALPWVSFGSDSASLAAEGVFLKSNPHPRAYGNFARLLGKYVREEGIISLEEAIHRLTSMPAENLGLIRRGVLKPGYFADVVAFDPETIQDHATFEKPHQYATGVVHVLVNGTPVVHFGEHTGAKPGRVVRGPGTVRR